MHDPALPPAPPWTLTYADGSGNVYGFAADDDGVRFTYAPVTPARSSSGVYSGGAPVDLRLAADDPRLAALWQQARALEADTAQHAAARNKGDGAFTVTQDDRRREFLIVRPATRAFEAFLERDLRRLADR